MRQQRLFWYYLVVLLICTGCTMVNSRKSQHQRSSSSSSSSLRDKLASDTGNNQNMKPIPTSRAYNTGGSGSGGDGDGFDTKSRHEVGISDRNSKDDGISGGTQEMVVLSSVHNNNNNDNNRGFDEDDDYDGPHIYIDNSNSHRSYSSSSARSSFPQYHHHRSTGEAAAASNFGSQQSSPHATAAAAAAIARPELNPLVRQTTTASIALLFGLLIWRSLTSFELASQFTNSSLLLLALVPSVALLVTNIAGFLLNIIKPYNFKNHLKVILAINIVREWIELIYSLFMIVKLTWSSSSSSLSSIPRETYFGSMFMNIWWCVVCFSFSRSRWVLKHTLSNSEIKYLQQKQLYEQQQQRGF